MPLDNMPRGPKLDHTHFNVSNGGTQCAALLIYPYITRINYYHKSMFTQTWITIF